MNGARFGRAHQSCNYAPLACAQPNIRSHLAVRDYRDSVQTPAPQNFEFGVQIECDVVHIMNLRRHLDTYAQSFERERWRRSVDLTLCIGILAKAARRLNRIPTANGQ